MEKKYISNKTWQDRREEFVNQVADMLDQGRVAWRKEWKAKGNIFAPYNPTTGKVYSGSNLTILGIAMMSKGLEDNRFVTYKQAQDQGWQVKKGSKGFHIEKAMRYDKKTKKEFNSKSIEGLSKEEKEEYIRENTYFMIKNYVVFNGSDIEGIPALEKVEIPKEVQYNKLENIFENSGVPILYGGDRAFYQPAEDFIMLPTKKSFTSEDTFYSTALHELSHSTGHESRLNRDLTGRFGSESYAKEELIAELGAVFSSMKLGFDFDNSVLDNSKAYLQGWASRLRDNKELLFECAKIADGVSEYIVALDKTKELEKEKKNIKIEYYPNGKIKEKAEINEKGIKEGIAYTYFGNGNLQSKGLYINGKKDGIWEYNSSVTNKFSEKYEYKKGSLEGLWETYYQSGQLKSKGQLNEGSREEGKFTFYYENGNIKEEGNYKNGKKEGEWKFYNENGQLEATKIFKAGQEVNDKELFKDLKVNLEFMEGWQENRDFKEKYKDNKTYTGIEAIKLLNDMKQLDERIYNNKEYIKGFDKSRIGFVEYKDLSTPSFRIDMGDGELNNLKVNQIFEKIVESFSENMNLDKKENILKEFEKEYSQLDLKDIEKNQIRADLGDIGTLGYKNEEGKKIDTWYEFDKEGKLTKEENYNKVGELDGESKKFKEGNLIEINNYRAGLLKSTEKINGINSEYTSYHENGSLESKMKLIYESKDIEKHFGKKDGKVEFYYDNGQLNFEENYKNGLKNGSFKSYHKNGQLKSEVNYINSKMEGLYKEYYNNGKIKTEENYKNNRLNGNIKSYYENGKLEKEINYENGQLIGKATLYHKNGNLQKELNYKNDRLDGEQKNYYKNGSLQTKMYYKDGLKNGEVKTYHENGNIKLEYSYQNNKKEGEYKKYNKEGILEKIDNYKKNKLDGISRTYNENGNIIGEAFYKSGKEITNQLQIEKIKENSLQDQSKGWGARVSQKSGLGHGE